MDSNRESASLDDDDDDDDDDGFIILISYFGENYISEIRQALGRSSILSHLSVYNVLHATWSVRHLPVRRYDGNLLCMTPQCFNR